MAVKLKVNKDEFQKRLAERFGLNQAPSKAGNQVLPKQKMAGATDLVSKKLKQSNVSQSKPVLPKEKKASVTDRTATTQTASTAKRTPVTPNAKKASATDRTAKQVRDMGQERNKDKEGWVNPNGIKKEKKTTKPATDLPANLKPNYRMGQQESRARLEEALKSGNVKQPEQPTMKQDTEGLVRRSNNNKAGIVKPITKNAKKASATDRTATETPAEKKTVRGDSGPVKTLPERKTKSQQTAKKTETAGPGESTKQRIKNAMQDLSESGMNVKGTLSNSKKIKGSKPTQKSFTKSKKDVSIEKKSSTKEKVRKAFNAAAVMKERRAKAMANRDKSKNPNNVNLRGIVKTKKTKGKR